MEIVKKRHFIASFDAVIVTKKQKLFSKDHPHLPQDGHLHRRRPQRGRRELALRQDGRRGRQPRPARGQQELSRHGEDIEGRVNGYVLN